jgi:quinol monooxygenase YgiN
MAPHQHRKKPRRAARVRTGAREAQQVRDGVTLVVVLRARKGQEAALEGELRTLVRPTRAEPGSEDQPGLFFLHEIWATRDDHTRHLETPHMKRWAEQTSVVLESREGTFWKKIV